jgi:hypothetical protein
VIKSISQKYQEGKEVTERELRVQALRNLMRDRSHIKGPQIDAYIVTTFDEHHNHQENGIESRLQYISGFSGPIADAVVSSCEHVECLKIYQRNRMINYIKI